MIPIHSEARIDLLRADIPRIDIEADSAEARVSFDETSDVFVETGIDALAAMFWRDVDALNPPDQAISPIAPLVRDERRADYSAVLLSNKVSTFRRLLKDSIYTARTRVAIEIKFFSLGSHPDLKLDDRGSVARRSLLYMWLLA